MQGFLDYTFSKVVCTAAPQMPAPLTDHQQSRLDKVFSFVEQQANRKKVVRISDVGSTVWQRVQAKAHLAVSPYHGTFAVTEEDAPPKFSWDERLERVQADRYMPHLNRYFPVSKREYQWIDAANHHQRLFNVSSLAHQFGYEFAGTTDVAIVLRQAARIGQPATGLRVVFELKKKHSNDDHYQALITLLMSNVLSGPLKPIVILTDLAADYVFYWLDDHTIFYYAPDSPGMALGIVKAFMQQEQVSATAEVHPVQVALHTCHAFESTCIFITHSFVPADLSQPSRDIHVQHCSMLSHVLPITPSKARASLAGPC